MLFLSHELIEQLVASVSEELPGLRLLSLLLILELDVSLLKLRLLWVLAFFARSLRIFDLAAILLLPVLVLMLAVLQEPDSIEVVKLGADELEAAPQLDLDLAEHRLVVVIDALDAELLSFLLVTRLIFDVLPGGEVAASGLDPPLHFQFFLVAQLQSTS